MTTPQDRDPLDREAPFEELQESDESVKYVDDESPTSFFDARWWRWAGIGVAVLIAIAFTIPLLIPLFSGSGQPAPEQPLGRASVPDFVLQAADGTTVRLSDETRRNDAVVLVFYRGYF